MRSVLPTFATGGDCAKTSQLIITIEMNKQSSVRLPAVFILCSLIKVSEKKAEQRHNRLSMLAQEPSEQIAFSVRLRRRAIVISAG